MESIIHMTVFTDPMMGLSYESEPILDALSKLYGKLLQIRYVMSVLVRDVGDFMTPSECALPPEEGIALYCRRLARIYKSEESVGGLPINMEGFCLFDSEHRSSKPLCLAYKAAQLAAPDKADAFLRNLRHATVLDCRPTTHEDEILAVAEETGLNPTAFLTAFRGSSAEAALKQDLDFTVQLGIRSLPSYLIRCGDKAVRLQSFDVREFTAAIDSLR